MSQEPQIKFFQLLTLTVLIFRSNPNRIRHIQDCPCCALLTQSCLTFVTLGQQPTWLLSGFSGKNIELDCQFLLPEILPYPEIKPSLIWSPRSLILAIQPNLKLQTIFYRYIILRRIIWNLLFLAFFHQSIRSLRECALF